VALAVEADAERDRVRLGLQPVRLQLVRLELVGLELVGRAQPVGLVPEQVPEGERVAAARCLAHPTPLAR
jgi:hypothetical protein